MITVNIHQAKTQFSKLIEAAMHGDEVIIAKAGTPVVTLKPIKSSKQKRKPGILKNKIQISAEFNAPLPENLLNQFEGK